MRDHYCAWLPIFCCWNWKKFKACNITSDNHSVMININKYNMVYNLFRSQCFTKLKLPKSRIYLQICLLILNSYCISDSKNSQTIVFDLWYNDWHQWQQKSWTLCLFCSFIFLFSPSLNECKNNATECKQNAKQSNTLQELWISFWLKGTSKKNEKILCFLYPVIILYLVFVIWYLYQINLGIVDWVS